MPICREWNQPSSNSKWEITWLRSKRVVPFIYGTYRVFPRMFLFKEHNLRFRTFSRLNGQIKNKINIIVLNVCDGHDTPEHIWFGKKLTSLTWSLVLQLNYLGLTHMRTKASHLISRRWKAKDTSKSFHSIQKCVHAQLDRASP